MIFSDCVFIIAPMKALEEKIKKEGKFLPGNVLKVNSFLNQNIDTAFLMKIGKEISDIFADSKVDRILTIEASGIAIAVAAAIHMNVPVVFAKKGKASNIVGKVYTAPVHSYTHNNDYIATVTADFIKSGENVLLVDDFLAHGEALRGLLEIVKQAGANPVGAAIAIEKGFQGGGQELRDKGLRIESLAIVDSIMENSITFRH